METINFKKQLLAIVCLFAIFMGIGIVSSAADPSHPWSQINSFPSACGAGSYVSAIGSTLTCGTPATGGGSLWTASGSDIYYNAGNVGIGTSTPGVNLEVVSGNQAIHADGTGVASVIQADSTNSNGVYGTTTSNGGSGIFGFSSTSGNGAAGVSTWGNGVYAEASNSGNGVFARSDTGYGVYGQTNGDSAVIGDNIATGGTGGHNGVAGRSVIGYGVYAISTNNWGVYCHGTGCGGNHTWSNTSDERLKKNIVTLENSLEKVKNLRGVSFEWKDENYEGKNIGFIAQEVIEIIPEVVNKDSEGYYSLETSQFTAVLVEAIKEQQKQIEIQEKEIRELREDINSLKLKVIK